MQIAAKAYREFTSRGLAADSSNQEYVDCLPDADAILAQDFAGRNHGCSLAAPPVATAGDVPEDIAEQTAAANGMEPAEFADLTEGEAETEGTRNGGERFAAFIGGIGGEH